MSSSSLRASSARVSSIDIARFFGITLVFFGHLVEQVMYLGSDVAAAQYKWVYSFHMPLFFLLAGFVARTGTPDVSLPGFLKRRWTGRLVPYFFFCALVFVLSFFIPGWFPTLDLPGTGAYLDGIISTLMGFPAFNIPLWFLASLVGLEILHFFLGRFWVRTPVLLAAIVGFYLGGYYLNQQIYFFGEGLNFWMLNLVPLGYAFYLTGLLVQRMRWLEVPASRPLLAGLAAACLVAVFLTYDLNQGPFRMLEASIFLAGAPGHVFWFPFTALMGIALVLLCARLVPQSRFLQHMGEITLVIYGLHGLFYHFVNRPLAAWIGSLSLENGWLIFLLVGLLSVLSVLLAGGGAVILRRTVPFLVGVASRQPARRYVGAGL